MARREGAPHPRDREQRHVEARASSLIRRRDPCHRRTRSGPSRRRGSRRRAGRAERRPFPAVLDLGRRDGDRTDVELLPTELRDPGEPAATQQERVDGAGGEHDLDGAARGAGARARRGGRREGARPARRRRLERAGVGPSSDTTKVRSRLRMGTGSVTSRTPSSSMSTVLWPTQVIRNTPRSASSSRLRAPLPRPVATGESNPMRSRAASPRWNEPLRAWRRNSAGRWRATTSTRTSARPRTARLRCSGRRSASRCSSAPSRSPGRFRATGPAAPAATWSPG